jgi:SAM-dependent methyltransferase
MRTIRLQSRLTCALWWLALVSICLPLSVTAFGVVKPLIRKRSLTSSVASLEALVDDSFDFSSAIGWEQFYKESGVSSQEYSVLEWHSSVPLEVLADFIPLGGSNCLMVGCGTSDLPSVVYEKRSDISITLMDSSQTCIEQLSGRYGDTMSYVCGDATRLSSVLPPSKLYNIIIDKGLMDAIFCGEGWNGPIESLVKESSKVLSPGGFYLLASYRLPTSTKEFLTEVGSEVGLEWEFDCAGSNDRVGLSIARKKR